MTSSERAEEGVMEMDVTTTEDLSPIVLDDPTWGRLTIDREKLLDALGSATAQVAAASHLAQYKTETGYAINSSWALLLGGLAQALDAVIEQLDGTTP